MTCKDKLLADHPEWDVDHFNWVLSHHCPCEFMDIEDPKDCRAQKCTACWNREIPETTEKENATMAEKTRAQLFEEINQKANEIADLKKEIETLERYKEYEKMADELGAIMKAFVNSGFSHEEAFTLITTSISACVR